MFTLIPLLIIQVYSSSIDKIIILLYFAVLSIIIFFIIFERYLGLSKIFLLFFFISLSFNIELSLYGESYNNTHTGGLKSVISVTHIYILLVVWIVLIILSKYKNRITSIINVEFSLFLLLTITGTFSLFFSENIIATIYVLIRYVAILILFFILNNYSPEKVWKYFIFGMIFTVIVQSTIGVLQIIKNDSLGLSILGERDFPFRAGTEGLEKGLSGTLGHPGNFALFLIMVIPLLLITFLKSNNIVKNKFLLILTIGMGFVAVLISYSRTSIILMIMSIVSIFIGSIWINNRNHKKSIKIIRYGVLGTIIFTILIIPVIEKIIERFLYSDFVFQIGERTRISEIGFEVIFKNINNTLFGVGLNNYTDVISQFGSGFIYTHPVHNIYLLLWAEGGIFHLLVYLLILITVISKMFVVLKKGNIDLAYKALGLMVSVIVLTLYNLTGWAPYHNQLFILFSVIVILCSQVYNQYKKNNANNNS
jgi:hypothetical protein